MNFLYHLFLTLPYKRSFFVELRTTVSSLPISQYRFKKKLTENFESFSLAPGTDLQIRNTPVDFFAKTFTQLITF